MYDSTNIQDDPLEAQLVGYYIDGIYATSAAPVIARFPHAVLVPISAIGTNAGIVGDVEPGCMTVGESVGWVQMRRAAGADPTLYVNQMHGWAPVRYAFRSAGIPEPHYWVANYDGVAQIPPGAVAKQYANPTLTHGHFDLSVVADYWPGVDGLYGGGTGLLGDDLTPEQDQTLQAIYAILEDQRSSLLNHPLVGLGALHNQLTAVQDAIKTLPGGSVSTDLSPVLAAIADLKAHPAVASDPALLVAIEKVDSHFSGH